MNEQQYTAVVAQNKSLQGELRLYKRMVDLIMNEYYFEEDKPYYLEKWKQQALQELEAEND